MADESESLVLGVEYDGESGIQQFVNALAPLPEQVGKVMDILAREATANGGQIGTEQGKAIASAMIRALQGELAGLSLFTGTGGTGTALDMMGISEESLSNTKLGLKDIRRMLDDFKRTGIDGKGPEQASFSKANILGLRDVQLSANDATQAEQELQGALDQTIAKLRLMRTAYDAIPITRSGKFVFSTGDPLDYQFNGATIGLSDAAGWNLKPGDLIRNSDGLVDVKATENKILDLIGKSFGQIQTQETYLRELLDAFRKAPILSHDAEKAQKVLAPPPEAIRKEADAKVRAENTASQDVASLKKLARADAASRYRVAELTAGDWFPDIQARATELNNLRRERLARQIEEERVSLSPRMSDVEVEQEAKRRRHAEVDASRRVEAYQSAYDLRSGVVETERDKFGRTLAEQMLARAKDGFIPFSPEFVRPPTFRESFMQGFGGPQDAPFGQMVGQTARISLFYGAAYRGLALVQDAMRQVTQESLDYQGALTDISVATNRSRGEITGLAEGLGSIAASAGFSAVQGAQVGARSVGLWGLADASLADQTNAADITARVATQVARVTPGSDLNAVATQLVGTARAFNLGVDQLTRIQDSSIFIARQTGQDAQPLLGATANVATLGTAAGFSLEQLMAIIAQVGTTTGQNPEGTAGQFRQVLSREFTPVARRAEDVFGIDTSDLSTVAQVLERVASGPMSTEQLNRFSTIFGKGGSQQVALVALQNWDRIQGLSSGASNAQGAGEQAYKAAMKDIGQQLRVMGAEWMELGLMLTQSGVLDWIALAIKGATSVAEALQLVVGAFNEIPRPIRSVAAAVAEFMLVSRFLRSGMGAGMIASLGGGAARTNAAIQAAPGFVARAFPTFAGVAAQARGGLNTAFATGAYRGINAVVPATGRAFAAVQPGLRAVGGGSAAVGALGIASAAYIVGDQLVKSFEHASAGADAFGDAAHLAAVAVSPDDYLGAARAARMGAQEARDSTLYGLKPGDVANLIPSIVGSLSGGNARSRELTDLANEYEAKAAEVEARQRRVLDTDPAEVFSDFSVDGLAESMKTLEDDGYSAAQRVLLLSDAMSRLAGTADAGKVFGFRANQIDDVAGGIAGGVVDSIGREQERVRLVGAAAHVNVLRGGNLFQNALGDIDTDAVRGTIQDLLIKRLSAMGDQIALSDSDINDMVNLAIGGLEHAGGDEYLKLPEESKKAIQNSLSGQIRRALQPYSVESVSKDVSGFLNEMMGGAQILRDEALMRGDSDVSAARTEISRLDSDAASLQSLQGQGVMTEEDSRRFEYIKLLILQKKRELVGLRLAEIDRLTESAVGGVAEDNVTEQLRIRANGADSKFRIAARAYGDSVRINEHGVPVFDAEAGQQLSAASNEKFQIAQGQAKNDLAILQAQMSNVSPGNGLGEAMASYNSVLAAINSGIYTPGEAQMLQLQAQATQAAFNVRSVQVQGANANALANIDPRANLQRIQQQVANARREMGLYARSDPRYGQLRDQIAQLQVQYLEGVASEANAMASANIAGHTSSLEQAQVQVQNAQRTLSTQLRGTEGYYSALAALRQAKVQLAAEERSQADRQRRLGSDLTDPVAQARLDVQKARDELRAATRRGDGPDVRNQAELDLRNAQNAEEEAAFNQRLSDIQTANDLGRITHTAYMGYLQSEHDRLQAIGNRTRQQQEQLDQIDKLMKSAAEEMNGQFNIGDIDLPTVYDVRRAIGAGIGGGVNDYSNSNNNLTINGADFAQVVEYIQQLFGGASFSTTTISGRKA